MHISESIHSFSAKIPSVHISRPKELWAKFKGFTSLAGAHIFVAEKHNALQTIQEMNQQKSTNISLQGNAEFYSIENLKRRKALKRHPQIVQVLQELWELVNPDLENSLHKENFIALMIRLHCLMNPKPGDLDNVMELAEEDWIRDAGGFDTISKQKFLESIFELIDIWTKSVTLEEYLTLANRIVAGVSILDHTGLTNSKVLKDIREIRFDPVFTDAEGQSIDSVNSDEDLCWDDDLAVLQARKAMWEYDMLFKISKQKEEDKKQGASEMDIGEKVLGNRESELLRFTKAKGKHVRMIKPQKLMQTVARVYDAKIVQDNTKELRNIYLEDEGGRFDKFIMLWHTQQFINKQRAFEHVRLLLRSVKYLACYHPRLRVFAKMVGIPIVTPEGVEQYDRKFKPHATSQYLFPFFRYFLKTNPKTGQCERLEDWFGSDFAPKRVSKNDFLAAAKKTLKYVPQDSPKCKELTFQLESLCADDIGWKQYVDALDEVGVMNENVSVLQPKHTSPASPGQLTPKELDPVEEKHFEPGQSNISASSKAKTRRKLGVAVDINTVASTRPQHRTDDHRHKLTKSLSTNTTNKKLAQQRMHVLENVTRVVSSGKLQHHEPENVSRVKLLKSQSTDIFTGTRKQVSVAKFVDIDLAVCLLLPVWDADYEWKQIIILTSAIVMIKRWIHRYKARKLEGKIQEPCTQVSVQNRVTPSIGPKTKIKFRIAVVG